MPVLTLVNSLPTGTLDNQLDTLLDIAMRVAVAHYSGDTADSGGDTDDTEPTTAERTINACNVFYQSLANMHSELEGVGWESWAISNLALAMRTEGVVMPDRGPGTLVEVASNILKHDVDVVSRFQHAIRVQRIGSPSFRAATRELNAYRCREIDAAYEIISGELSGAIDPSYL